MHTFIRKVLSLHCLNKYDMVKNVKIKVGDTNVSIMLDKGEDDYISLTDMATFKDNDQRAVICNWMRNRGVIEYLGIWETLHNPKFNPLEFERFKNESGYNSFTMSPQKWIQATNAKGIISKSGRYGGTFAHKDIAFSFGMWLSPTFQLYIVKEYQRLKEQESNPLIEQWDVKRILSKANYSLHTDAVQKFVIPTMSLSKAKERIIYASEADVLNLALFGYTAKDWEEANPQLAAKRLNMRDTASINQLMVLTNLEALNAELLKLGNTDRMSRLSYLHKVAKEQLEVLNKTHAENKFRKLLSTNDEQKLLE